MQSTFQLHPLPTAALEALRAAASSEGCPEGLTIVGGLTEVRFVGGCMAKNLQVEEQFGWVGVRRFCCGCVTCVVGRRGRSAPCPTQQ